MMFDARIIQAVKDHARAEYPREACGVVSAGEYVPCANVAGPSKENPKENPEEFFRIDKNVYLKFLTGSGVQAVFHSHPNGPDCPTKDDMESQEASAVPWGILAVNAPGQPQFEPFWFGDQVPMERLLGRTFRMGVHDCWSAVRDWFRLNSDIRLPFFPREPNWWEIEGRNVLVDNFYAMGFREIAKVERIGDCLITILGDDIYSHCSVHVGGGLVYHHKPNRISMREPGHVWMKPPRSRCFRHKDFHLPGDMKMVWQSTSSEA